jgi:tyrosyl-tRNA synthetase
VLEVDQARVLTGICLLDLAVEAGFVPSRNAARRAVNEGSLKLDGKPLTLTELALPTTGREWRLSFGKKRHVRVTVDGRALP